MKSPEAILRVKEALGEGSLEWRKFQSFYIQDLFIRSVDPETTRDIVKVGGIVGKESIISGKKMLETITGTKIKAEI